MNIGEEISTIILTYNEEQHIERCILSAKKYSNNIIVIDSFSEDKTVEIAKSLGAKVLQNQFINYSKQFAWALENVSIQTEWILRLDADEYLEDKLIDEIKIKLKNLPKEITGVNFKRKHIFLNKWIKFGGRYPLVLLRLWRSGKGYIEERWMDEHIILKEGKVITLKGSFCDHNLKTLNFFVKKHNWYADREALDVIVNRFKLINQKNEINFKNSSLKTWLTRIIKESIYNKLPFGISPIMYFLYRYIILLGILDGKEGLVYHFLQGFWYRLLIDAKIMEYSREINKCVSKEQKLKRLSELTNLKVAKH